MVKFKVRAPRHGEGSQPPRRWRRSDPHLLVQYTRSRRTQRVYLASVRLPPNEDEAALFLGCCDAKLVEIGLGSERIGLEMAKIRARFALEAEKESGRLAVLRKERHEQLMAAGEARAPPAGPLTSMPCDANTTTVGS